MKTPRRGLRPAGHGVRGGALKAHGGGGGPSHALREMVERSLRGEESTLPATTLEWVYSKDAAAAACRALRASGLTSRVFHVGMGRLYTPGAIAAAMASVVPGARVRVAAERSPHPVLQDMRHAMDGTRARAELGYVPRYDLAAGLRDHVEWAATRSGAREAGARGADRRGPGQAATEGHGRDGA